ncbi:MAG: hypothetical protein WC815_18990 [Vicinamibacterales bacterium]
MLVLDEPTNDLDLETLELLEAQLVEWPGTLLLVSHDRRFLDNVVSSTLVFEGDGKVQEYVGGYEDWLRQSKALPGAAKESSGLTKEASGVTRQSSGTGRQSSGSKTKSKRSFKEEKEYADLPKRIAALEEEQKRLQAAMARPDFYKEGADVIRQAVTRVEAIERELLTAMARWDALDSVGKSA